MVLPVSRGRSEPVYFARLSSSASPSRKVHSCGVKSSSLTKLRLRRLKAISEALALDRAGHAAWAAPAPPQLVALDGDDLHAVLAQVGVGGDVALVGHDHA